MAQLEESLLLSSLSECNEYFTEAFLLLKLFSLAAENAHLAIHYSDLSETLEDSSQLIHVELL